MNIHAVQLEPEVSQPAFSQSDFDNEEGKKTLRDHGLVIGKKLPGMGDFIMELAASAQRHATIEHRFRIDELLELAEDDHYNTVSAFVGELARYGFTDEADFAIGVGRGAFLSPHRDIEPTLSITAVKGTWYAVRPSDPDYYRGDNNRGVHYDFLPPSELMEAEPETIMLSDGMGWHRSPQVNVDRASLVTMGLPDLDMFRRATLLEINDVS